MTTGAEQTDQTMAYDPSNAAGSYSIRRYFKILRIRLMAGLFIGFMIPHVILSAYFHVQFNSTLKKSGKLNLAAIADSQKNTIDLFLQERVVNLFNLLHSREFSVEPTQAKMDHYLSNLRQTSDAFIDVGFLNENGIQVGYSGPYTMLLGKDYSKEGWFKTLASQKADYYISDIYMGFRKKAHFTIATRQLIDDRMYVLKTTLDPDKFFLFLRSISQGKGVESTLINREGRYQVVDPGKDDFLSLTDMIPPKDSPSGVMEINGNEGPVLVAYTWLKETPWALMVQQPLSVAHAGMFRARQILIASLAVIVVTIALIIFFVTRKLVDQAQAMAEKGKLLQHQLFHATKLAAIGELATGVAHEINNPLAIITATTGVVRDMMNPEFHMNSKPDEILAELAEIDAAAFRAKGITSQLLNLGRKNVPKLELSDIHQILDEVLGGVKEREFITKGIEIRKNYAPDLPSILIDPDPIRQVFLNLVNNAGDAIHGAGAISITTGVENGFVTTTITDSGEGIPPDVLKRIFDPFFTTKPAGKGTGLGLSVSMSIVELMGGKIDVQSALGFGSSFTVSLPLRR
jgi:two-component system NtrC family sensor kinase